MMMMNARHVDWSDRAAAIPVFLTVVLMPFTYSITAGVAAGVISYVAIKVAQGKAREIGAFMWVPDRWSSSSTSPSTRSRAGWACS